MVDPTESTVITVISGFGRSMDLGGEACLVVVYGDDLGSRFVLSRTETVVGRSRDCDIQLEQESASRRHAVLRYGGGEYSVEDLGSTNGTNVNDEPISLAVLEDGDELRFGRTVMRFLQGDDVEKRYRETLVDIARNDGLTRALTRSSFLEVLNDEASRARRYQRFVALATVTLSGWDQYVAGAGRIYSDLRLRRIAQTLNSTLRRSDKLGRLDEAVFGILLPETDGEQALQCVRRLEALIADETEGLTVEFGFHAAMGAQCIDIELLHRAGVQSTMELELNDAFV